MASEAPVSLKERFDAMAFRWIEDAFVSKPSDVPDTVYHYTDAGGLVGMLRNHSIWATDHRFVNDKSERGYTHKIMRVILKDQLSKTDDPLMKVFYKEILDLRLVPVPCDTFIFSLSEEKDDLSQWRGYAREGQGFTVGFCGPTLSDMAGPKHEFSFFRVEYVQEKQEDTLHRALNAFEKELKKTASDPHQDQKAATTQAAKSFDWLVENQATVNKHGSFQDENEWRIAAFVPEKDRLKDVKVRVSGARLVSYIELKPKHVEKDRLPVKSIGIGPGFTEADQFTAVESLCLQSGYDVHIYEADTPYRRVGP